MRGKSGGLSETLSSTTLEFDMREVRMLPGAALPGGCPISG